MQLDFNTIEKSFANKKNNINNISVVVNPSGNGYAEILPEYINKKIKNNNYKIIHVSKNVYEQITDINDLEMYTQNRGMLKYSIDNCYLHDLGCGILTDITLNKNNSNLISDLEITKSKTIIDIGIESLKKLMFGHIVNENGRAIIGAGRIIEKGWESVKPYLYKQKMPPILDISINKTSQKGNKIEAIVRGTPVSISRVYGCNGKISGFQIELDNIFYPTKKEKDNNIIGSHYIRQIIGLTAFLQYGKKLVNEQYEIDTVEPKQARRLILTCQAAIDADKFPFVSSKIVTPQKSNSNRIEVSLLKGIVKSLCPKAIIFGEPHFRTFIEYCNSIGLQYITAFNDLGLELHEKVLTPVKNRAARFDKDRVKIIFELKNNQNKQ